jgi:hypothetical protein
MSSWWERLAIAIGVDRAFERLRHECAHTVSLEIYLNFSHKLPHLSATYAQQTETEIKTGSCSLLVRL